MAASARLDTAAAAAVLARGGVVAYPTEGVWGLGCDPFDAGAVHRLLDIKRRPVDKGVILVAGTPAQLAGIVDWAGLDAGHRDAVLGSWPGPNTWIVPALPTVPGWLTGAHAGIAVRVSAHPGVVALCAAFGGPLVSTSANLSGEPAVHAADALDPRLLARIDGVAAGETGARREPSTIRDAATGRVLRG
ncbi:Sua5/YciO/YrdC/YwlC family protein [Luteimonas sp. FCS-9]|uniref:Sua5/YciO/YrdC/YwlC family protein n=1 Tax=Luteimonas sp. FCS-9 TaxID=1547516 RepID=UPI00063E8E1F|nr:Sua5/YciO/YrdC/YwlC family protein [Luteimonas sp. FCS-9]KLJ00104.1 tRNA threonylcarbamoyladenosine biosynthesis protein RimN [Luteimonas sp. FCS-9]